MTSLDEIPILKRIYMWLKLSDIKIFQKTSSNPESVHCGAVSGTPTKEVWCEIGEKNTIYDLMSYGY